MGKNSQGSFLKSRDGDCLPYLLTAGESCRSCPGHHHCLLPLLMWRCRGCHLPVSPICLGHSGKTICIHGGLRLFQSLPASGSPLYSFSQKLLYLFLFQGMGCLLFDELSPSSTSWGSVLMVSNEHMHTVLHKLTVSPPASSHVPA